MDICDSEQLNALARMMPDPCQVLMSSVEWAVDGLKGIEPIGRKRCDDGISAHAPWLHQTSSPLTQEGWHALNHTEPFVCPMPLQSVRMFQGSAGGAKRLL